MDWDITILINMYFLKAAECTKRAISLKPRMSEYYLKAALAYEKAGELSKSNQMVEKLRQFDKNNPRCCLFLIKNNLKLGNFEKAVIMKKEFEDIKITNPKQKSDMYYSAASSFIDSENYDQALNLLYTAKSCQPGNPAPLNNIGVCFYYLGKLDSARKYFSEAVKIDSSNVEFQKNLKQVNL